MTPSTHHAFTLKRLILYVGGAVLALVIILMLYVGWVVNQPRGKPGKFAAQIDALVREGQVVDGPNGFDILAEINSAIEAVEVVTLAQMTTTVKPGAVQYDLLYTPSSGPETDQNAREQRQTEQAAAEACMSAILSSPVPRLMDKLANSTWAARKIATNRAVYSMEFIELSTARRTARLAMARLHLAAERGDFADAAASVRCGITVARHCANQFMIIDGFVGLAIDALVSGRVRELALSRPCDAQLLSVLLAEYRRAVPIDFRKIARGERLCAMDMIELSHTDDGSGSGVLYFNASDQYNPASSEGGSPALGLVFARKRATIERADEYYSLLDAAMTVSTFPEVAQRVDQASAYESAVGRSYVLLRMLMPAAVRVAHSRLPAQADHNATACILAIELFERQTGALPVSLADLTTPRDGVPALLSSAQTIDPFSGQPLVYRPGKPFDQAGEGRAISTRERRYVLYTVAADGVDNGGTTPANLGDRQKAMISNSPGYDVDFTLGN